MAGAFYVEQALGGGPRTALLAVSLQEKCSMFLLGRPVLSLPAFTAGVMKPKAQARTPRRPLTSTLWDRG